MPSAQPTNCGQRTNREQLPKLNDSICVHPMSPLGLASIDQAESMAAPSTIAALSPAHHPPR